MANGQIFEISKNKKSFDSELFINADSKHKRLCRKR